MDSIREQIMQAVVAVLNDTGAPAAVFRGRTDPLEPANLPAIVLLSANRESVIEGDDGDSVRRELEISIAAIVGVNPADGETIDQETDPLTNWIVAQLAGGTLGGLAIEVREVSTSWGPYPSGGREVDYFGARVDFLIVYYTDRADQTALGNGD